MSLPTLSNNLGFKEIKTEKHNQFHVKVFENIFSMLNKNTFMPLIVMKFVMILPTEYLAFKKHFLLHILQMPLLRFLVTLELLQNCLQNVEAK